MKKQEMLFVKWSEREEETYYIDKDHYSKAHRLTKNVVNLNSFSGVYTFNEITREVLLFDGVKTKQINVVSWKTFTTPSI